MRRSESAWSRWTGPTSVVASDRTAGSECASQLSFGRGATRTRRDDTRRRPALAQAARFRERAGIGNVRCASCGAPVVPTTGDLKGRWTRWQPAPPGVQRRLQYGPRRRRQPIVHTSSLHERPSPPGGPQVTNGYVDHGLWAASPAQVCKTASSSSQTRPGIRSDF
jgi:hypothetical protein